MTNKTGKQLDRLEKNKIKIEKFSDILDSLSSTEEKKKALWKEIYENAIADRENAGMLFTDAYQQMGGGTFEHATLGPVMTKYLERMNKANEQILKLAELIHKAEERESVIDSDNVFSQISGV